ncbi:MAG: T9SS type A sorting domain-containing protein, partial [Bacteroidia bacterium]
PTGALAVTFSMWSGCFNSTTKDLHWYLDDVDMVFDDVLSNNRTWNKELRDPTADEYDLESVALHELGHAHQLGHIIDATGVMHYSIKNGEKKRLLNDKVDVVAGLDVMQYSTDTTGCSDVFAMVAIKNNCKLTNIVDVDAVFTISDNVLCVDDILWIKNLSTPIGSNFYWRIPKGFSFEADHGDSVGYRANTAGIYNFGLVVENSGFWDSTSYPIQINKTPEPNFKIDDITCNGAANGKATFILSEEKGTPPFDIVWADTEKSQNPRNKMTKGTYTYTCIDATGCSRLGSVRIAEPDSLLITKIASEPSWGGLNRGKAYVIATGGTPPYKYNWNDANLQKTDTANNLAAGDYTVEIVDDNDCVINGEVSVTEVSSGLTHPNINALIKPNPASETLFIENEYEFNTVVVYTINGKKVIETQLFRGVNQVDINILQTGIYYVLLQGEKHEIKGKLLVR